MATIVSIRPLLAVLVSAAGALLVLLCSGNRNLREGWTFAAGAAKFLIVASMLPGVLAGRTFGLTISTLLPGLDIALRVDPLGILFALTASILWIVTSIYSVGYMRTLHEHDQTRYFACFAVALSGAIGLAFSANLFTFFIFYEIITFSTYPLVAHHGDAAARRGGAKYLAYLVGASKLLLLGGMAIIWDQAGSLDFVRGGLLGGVEPNGMLALAFFMCLFGLAKAAIMPLHSWLPSAMVAPTPVSALLHAVAVVKAGVFGVLRLVLFIFGPWTMQSLGLNAWGIALACLTIVLASVMALAQQNLKARLAYSTVSQLSYVVLGACLLTPAAITGGMLHIAVHAFAKITLFFCAGSIFVATRKTEIGQFSGLGRRMPWTMAAFTVGSLAMIGVPPLSGFVSKWYLATGAAADPWALAALVTSTLLNAAYFMPIVVTAWFGELPAGESGERSEAPALVVGPLVATALATIVIGFWPDLLLAIVREAAR
jgi:multicomponent Na+:H+ antiporter subunit D